MEKSWIEIFAIWAFSIMFGMVIMIVSSCIIYGVLLISDGTKKILTYISMATAIAFAITWYSVLR